jgi:hypothetical protein
MRSEVLRSWKAFDHSGMTPGASVLLMLLI